MKIVFVTFVCFILLISCQDKKLSELPEITESKEVSFSLDSLSSFLALSLEYNENTNHLSVYNDLARSLDFYSMKTMALSKRVKLVEEGPNSTGEKGTANISHLVIDGNNVLVFNKINGTLFILDSVGTVKRSIKIDQASEGHHYIKSVPDPFLVRPMVYSDSIVYIPGGLINNKIHDESLVKNVITVDLRNDNVNWVFNRPKLYNKGNWGMNGNKLELNTTYDKHSKQFFLAYAAEDSISIVSNNFKNIKKVVAKSSVIDDIEPLTERGGYSNSASSVKYDYTTPLYQNIIFDPYRKLIYRLTYLGLSDEKFEIGGDELLNGRLETIMVFDRNFSKIGEYKIPQYTYFTPMYFVNKDGLHFAKKAKYERDNTALSFGVFKFN